VNILAVDTSTLRLGIGIVTEAGESFSRRWADEGHSAPLFGRIEFAMDQLDIGLGDIGLLSVISGPGSFTGLRIGMSGVLGWAVSAGLPVQSVDSFAAMRASVPDSMYPLLTAIHSRGEDFYMQYLESPDITEDSKSFMGSVESLSSLPTDRCSVCGPGTVKLIELMNSEQKEQFKSAGNDHFEPDMCLVCKVADEIFAKRETAPDDYKIEPYYMTLSQAQINFERRERRL
jgi:tRNA threonylcarbamoyl adenosine modification protein YeaZ